MDNHNGGLQSVELPFVDCILAIQDTFPIITFDQGTNDLGEIKKGQKRELEFTFTNTGTASLLIELAIACKCKSLEWSTVPVPPGEKGFVKVEKAIDIIANTRPIVVKAWFKAIIIE